MNTQIYSLFIILAITILFLVLDLIRIDLLALLCMLALGWTGILTPEELLRGFSSNAVFVMMAVMVMGRAIDKTGIMDHFSRFVLEKVGTDRQKIIAWISLAIGSISGFIQNIGAVALFLPGIITTARRAKIPAPALIMPIGFAAIIGGTLTMVGSGPMLLVNDILRGADLPPYSVFSVTPLGILLLSVSILYFFIRGEKLLYKHSKAGIGGSEQEQLINKLHLPNNISHFRIEKESPLTGKTPEESGIWQDRGVHVLGLMRGADIEYSPWRGTVFESGQEIALLGSPEDIQTFAREYKLLKQNPSQKFDALRDPNK